MDKHMTTNQPSREDKIAVLDALSTIFMKSQYVSEVARELGHPDAQQLANQANGLKANLDALRFDLDVEWRGDMAALSIAVGAAKAKVESYIADIQKQANIMTNIADTLDIVQQIVIVAASIAAKA